MYFLVDDGRFIFWFFNLSVFKHAAANFFYTYIYRLCMEGAMERTEEVKLFIKIRFTIIFKYLEVINNNNNSSSDYYL